MGHKSKKEEKEVVKRDFSKEYEEIMRIADRNMEMIEQDWQKNGQHIKKFSLLKNTPTPMLSDHTNPFSC